MGFNNGCLPLWASSTPAELYWEALVISVRPLFAQILEWRFFYVPPPVASIFNIPNIRLAPEMDELLRTHIRTNPRVKTKV